MGCIGSDFVMQGLLSNERLGNSSLWGSLSGNIKNVYFGTATVLASTTSLDVTLSSVDKTKCIILLSTSGGSTSDGRLIKGILTTNTNLNLSRGGSQPYDAIVEWTVIEFMNIKSLQMGSGTWNGSGEFTATFSSVKTSKSILFTTYSTTSSIAGVNSYRQRLTSPTSLGIYIASLSQADINWQVVEFL